MLVLVNGHLAVTRVSISIELFRLYRFMEENKDKKRYSPSGGAIFEMVCSILLILLKFRK